MRYDTKVLKMATIVLAVVFTLIVSSAWADTNGPVLKVMTQNMDAGTDLMYFFIEDPMSATQDTYKELLAAKFRGRINALAHQIAVQQPDLIALQEVTLWQLISPTNRRPILADQLELLKKALRDLHQPYEVVRSQELTDIIAPLKKEGLYLRFLDRNVILARTDNEGLTLSNVQSGLYAARISPVPGFPEQLNGWISVDANIQEKRVRFFNTHLESPISVDDPTQEIQGQELIEILGESSVPVILAGDFNSDASGLGIGPLDQTSTAGDIVTAGYADAWLTMNNPAEGLTWPLFGEDIYSKTPLQPFERIDLIFVGDYLEVLDISLAGDKEPLPSDHAGVVATIELK
jgi:endonuclease/exonuclease/phosphatase family metal-dependent hydrolase